jgi:hypothetical protein
MHMATGLNRWPERPALRATLLALLLAQLSCLAVGAQDMMELTVRPGDTLIGIGQRYLDQPARWPEVQRLNQIRNNRRLQPGATLRVPTDWLRWSALTAEVVHVAGSVSGNKGPLAAGMRLGAGDSFDTGAQGALTLRFSDGGLAVFAPLTRAGLGVSRESPAAGLRATTIDLQRGSVETTATPLRAPASRFDVRTPRVVTAVRGTRFRVALDGEVSRHEVLEGRVALAGAAPEPLAVGLGEGVRAEAGQLGRVVQLLGAPDVSALPRRVERTAQALQLPSMAGATGWRWQVAADPGFTQLLQDVKTLGPVWVLTALPDGDYHLRVRAADAQELEGRESAVAFVLAARPEPPLLVSPSSGSSVTVGVPLVWAEQPGVLVYHLQLARDGAFTDLVLDRADIAASRWAPEPALPPGKYHWRVASQRREGPRGPFGDAGSFTVLEPTALAPPQLGAGGLRLAWSGPSGFSHRVQVSRDPAFASTVVDQVVAGASLDLPQPQAGAYHVRTQLLLPDGASGPWSAVQRFEVSEPPPRHPWGMLLLLLLPLLL